jgi:hypothetical protein
MMSREMGIRMLVLLFYGLFSGMFIGATLSARHDPHHVWTNIDIGSVFFLVFGAAVMIYQAAQRTDWR